MIIKENYTLPYVNEILSKLLPCTKSIETSNKFIHKEFLNMIIALAGVTQIGIDNQVEDINYETSQEMFGTIFTLFYKSWLITFNKHDLVSLLLEAIGVIILFIDTSRYMTICN